MAVSSFSGLAQDLLRANKNFALFFFRELQVDRSILIGEKGKKFVGHACEERRRMPLVISLRTGPSHTVFASGCYNRHHDIIKNGRSKGTAGIMTCCPCHRGKY